MTAAGDRHRRVSELLGAYALHAVDPDEARAVDEHLDECPRCRHEVDLLREVAAEVGHSSAPPSEALWDRIASQLAGAPGGTGPEPGAPGPAHRAPSGAPEPAAVVDLRRGGSRPGRQDGRRRRGPGRAAWAVAGGAAAACAALAVVFGVNWADTSGQVHDLQAALAHQGAAAAVDAALASPGHRVVELRSNDGVHLAEVVVRQDGAGYMVDSSMPALPRDQTYQLWAKITDQPISVGLLGSRPAEGAAFSLGSSAHGASELMVTVEPSGGVVTPDRAPVATASLG